MGAATSSGGTIANASRVIAGVRGSLRSCYSAALAENPNARGSIRFTVSVGATGGVENVDAVASGLPVPLVECAKARIRVAQFEAPVGGKAVLQFPAIFQSPQAP